MRIDIEIKLKKQQQQQQHHSSDFSLCKTATQNLIRKGAKIWNRYN